LKRSILTSKAHSI